MVTLEGGFDPCFGLPAVAEGSCRIRMPGNSMALARVGLAVIASGMFTQICSGLCCPGKCSCWCFRKKFLVGLFTKRRIQLMRKHHCEAK